MGGFSKGCPGKADKTKLQISILLLMVIFRFKKKINFVEIPVNISRYFVLTLNHIMQIMNSFISVLLVPGIAESLNASLKSKFVFFFGLERGFGFF